MDEGSGEDSVKTVLITGGTGSFGRAFVHHLLDTTDSLIRVFSRDEQKQEAMKREINSPRVRFLLGDVRDYRRSLRAVRDCDLVVHAAALKIIPAGEYNPDEVIKTNVTGSDNIIHACIEAQVSRVVCISSDKAVAPVNLYGNTKACMERLAVLANSYSGDVRIGVVRYGNVIGSRGSILTILKRQVAGGAIHITHPDMTRFWMTLPQACAFVWRAQATMTGGEIFVPKLSGANVMDLCSALHPGVPIVVDGMRPGEKMHEWLTNEYEVADDAGWTYIIREGAWKPGNRPISSKDCIVPASRLLNEPEFAEEIRRAAA